MGLPGCNGAETRGNSVPTPFLCFALKWVRSCFKMAIFWVRSHTSFVSTTSLEASPQMSPLARDKVWTRTGTNLQIHSLCPSLQCTASLCSSLSLVLCWLYFGSSPSHQGYLETPIYPCLVYCCLQKPGPTTGLRSVYDPRTKFLRPASFLSIGLMLCVYCST